MPMKIGIEESESRSCLYFRNRLIIAAEPFNNGGVQ